MLDTARSIRDFKIELVGPPADDLTLQVKNILSTGPQFRAKVCVNSVPHLYITAEDLDSRNSGYGLIYRLEVPPQYDQAVRSWSSKKQFNIHNGNFEPSLVTGEFRVAGSASKHQVDNWELTLPHLGEIEQRRYRNSREPSLLLSESAEAREIGQSSLGVFAAALSLGKGKIVNEDAVLVRAIPPVMPNRGESLLLAVADGMGGYPGAAYAARSVLRTLQVSDCKTELGSTIEQMGKDMYQLYVAVSERTESGLNTIVSEQMGAPVAAVQVFNDRCIFARRGDCRVLHVRFEDKLAKKIKINVTKDDKGKKGGVINPVTIDDGNPDREPNPAAINSIDMSLNDWLVVTTDGITKFLTNKEVARILIDADDPKQAIDQILNEVATKEQRSETNGDNQGVIVYRHGSQHGVGDPKR
ncbi:MAG: PP2C family protein-serine/threonine phosphatase [Pseudomonadota bacterium]|jgi:serine/threonine protein phosphatase PrpC